MTNVETDSERDYVGISLWITSEVLTVSSISSITGLQPSYTQKRGDLIGNTRRRYERHSWNLGKRLYFKPEDYNQESIERLFNDFMSSLQNSSSTIKELSEQHSVSIDIIFNVKDMPYLGLTREQVQAASNLGARLSFDVMVYGSD